MVVWQMEDSQALTQLLDAGRAFLMWMLVGINRSFSLLTIQHCCIQVNIGLEQEVKSVSLGYNGHCKIYS